MSYEAIAVEQETIRQELRQVFDAPTTEVLGRVLGRLVVQREEARVTREEFQALRVATADLMAVVRELTKAQQRTEERVNQLALAQQRTEERVNQLVLAQQRTEERVNQLVLAQQRTEEQVQQLIAAQQRTEERMSRLEEAVQRLTEVQARTEEEVRRLADVQRRMGDQLAALRGSDLEARYQRRASAYFGPLLRRVRVLTPVELEENLEDRLSQKDYLDLLQVDLLVTGRPRHPQDAPPVWLAVELSTVIDQNDVDRARRRAAALRQAGYLALPVVAGEQITEGASQAVESQLIPMLLDGRTFFWEEALAQALRDHAASTASGAGE